MTCEEYQKSINKNENDAQFELWYLTEFNLKIDFQKEIKFGNF